MVRPPIKSTRKEFHTLHTALNDLHLGGIRYYSTVASTNDMAIEWAHENAKDMSLVLSDEQTNGRGRIGTKWLSSGKASLTFSLIIRPRENELSSMGLFTALAALAVIETIKKLPGINKPEIKWPNDVLLNGRKVCGILTEASWNGNDLSALVIGVGINISAESVPPVESINFPATSLEQEANFRIDRIDLLHQVLQQVNEWRFQLGKPEFIFAWEKSLASIGKQVKISPQFGRSWIGIVVGLDSNGGLRVLNEQGQPVTIHDGDVKVSLSEK